MKDIGYVYEFYDNPKGHGNPVYIGKTKNIPKRMNSHFNGESQGLLDNKAYSGIELVKYAECGTYGDAGIIERYLIGKKDPKLNTVYSREPVTLEIDIAHLEWKYIFGEQLNRLRAADRRKVKRADCVSFEVFFGKRPTAVEISVLSAIYRLISNGIDKTRQHTIILSDLVVESNYKRSIREIGETLKNMSIPILEMNIESETAEIMYTGTKKGLKQFVEKYDGDIVNGLNSKYAKTAYYHLSTYRDTGVWSLGIEEFIEIMALGKSYKPRDIRRQVIEPIGNECSKYFEGLTYFEKRGKKKSIERIMFKFDTNETSVQGEVKRQFLLEQLREGDWIKKEFAA